MRTALLLLLLLAPAVLAQESRLDAPVDLSIEDASAPDALALLAEVSGLDIRVDPSVAGLTADELARRIELKGVPARVALECVLDPNLEAEWAADHVRVRARPVADGLVTARHELGALLPLIDSEYGEDLVRTLIEENVAPGSWDAPCAIDCVSGAILVRHEAWVHDRVRRLLAELGDGARLVEVDLVVRREGRVIAGARGAVPSGAERRIRGESLSREPDGDVTRIEGLTVDVRPILSGSPASPWLSYRIDLERAVSDSLGRRHVVEGIAPLGPDAPLVIGLGDGVEAELRAAVLEPPPEAEGAPDPRIEETRRRLERTRFRVDLVEASFDEVVDRIRGETGCNVHVSPTVRWNTPIESTAFDCRADDLDAFTLLDRLRATLPIEATVRPGVLVLSAGPAPGDAVVRVHDVSLLTLEEREPSSAPEPGVFLPEPEAALRGIFETEEGGSAWCYQDRTCELVRSYVRSVEWDQDDRGLSREGARLIVLAPGDLQADVSDFLAAAGQRLEPRRSLRLVRCRLSEADLARLPPARPGSVHPAATLAGLGEQDPAILLALVPDLAGTASLVDVHRQDPARPERFTTGLAVEVRFTALEGNRFRLAVGARAARRLDRADGGFSSGEVRAYADLGPDEGLLVPTGTAPDADGRLEHLIVLPD